MDRKKENNINYETGEVVCMICKRRIGNYKMENFYSLIRKKYCKECAKKVRNAKKREYSKDRRKGVRELKATYKQALSELQSYTQELEVCLGKRHVDLKELFQDYLKPLGYTGLESYETREYIEEMKDQCAKTNVENERLRSVLEILLQGNWIDKLAKCERPELLRKTLDDAIKSNYMTKDTEKMINNILTGGNKND